MSFRLEITFSGLCLFVLDSDPAAGELIHVLMPDAGMMKHFPRIVYSRDYELPATPASAPPVKKLDKTKGLVQNDENVVELDDFPAIDIAGVLKGNITAAARFPLPAEILNVSDLAKLAGTADPGNRVAQKWFRNPLPNNGKCVARVTIPSTQLVAYNTTNQVVVDLPNGTQGVTGAACVTATYDVGGPPILQFGAGTKAVALKPSAGVIKLLVGDMMEGDYDHPPQLPAPMASHYPAFYDLLVAPPAKNKRPTPRLPGPSDAPVGGVDPVICMTGGGCGQFDLGC